MSVIVSDNSVDTAGTLVINHTPNAGGPIVSAASAFSAVVTNANRIRGNDSVHQSFYSYSAVPVSAFYTVEAIVYVMTNVNGFAITARQPSGGGTGGTGILVNYAAGAGRWTIAGPGISGDSAFASYTIGNRLHCTLILAAGLITFGVNGTTIFTRTVTGTPVVGLAGFGFSAQDTDSTGYQFENFSVNDSEGGALCGSTSVSSSLAATPTIQPSLAASITIECVP